MTQPNHSDINRSIGQLEGAVAAVKDTLDRMASDISELRKDVAELKAKESERKGGFAVLMVIAGIIGGLVTKFGAMLMGAVK